MNEVVLRHWFVGVADGCSDQVKSLVRLQVKREEGVVKQKQVVRGWKGSGLLK